MKVKSVGRGHVGKVIDITDADFYGWPASLDGEVYLSGSVEEGLETRKNIPMSETIIELGLQRGSSLKGRVKALEERVEALEALIAP